MKTLIISLILSTGVLASTLIQARSLKISHEHGKTSEVIPMGNYIGTYTYPLAHRYSVSANMDGFVTKINIKPYARVIKGETLFVIKSPKLLDLQSDYIATVLDLNFYKKEMMRLEPLAKKGIVASKRLLKCKNNYERSKASVAFKKEVLLAYGLSKTQVNKISKENKPYPLLQIKAPANTQVSMLNVKEGSFVLQGAQMAELIETQECHFEIDLPWALALGLKKGDFLYTNESEYEVFAISPEIDTASQTRGIDLHEEGDCSGRGGASVNVTMYSKKTSWSIPSSAVIKHKGSHIIFISTPKGYKSVKVNLLANLEGRSYISAPLNGSENIAVSSVLALKSLKEGNE